MTNFNILIGGAAGQGIDTISTVLEKTLKRMGYYVFTTKDYMSRIRGGHNFNQIRFGTVPLTSHRDDIDLILALNEETISIHQDRLVSKGKIICDAGISKYDEASNTIAIELEQAAKDAGNPRTMGTVAAGAALQFFGLPNEGAKAILKSVFSGTVLEANLKALDAGQQMVDIMHETTPPQADHHIYINGNQAMALGALTAGCRFYSAYPMTPSTGIMNYLSEKASQAGIVVEQAEDEIAAINMALGASYAGVRAMTGTSGGGFSLMVETVGLTSMLETPLVIANIQRPGPATGLPTRTEQSDLKFVISASHGEAPRMVIAVRHPEDAFRQTIRAFNLAEKYQLPVILLGDQFLGDSMVTLSPFDFDNVSIERHIAGEEALPAGKRYRRYAFTETGISPRIIPGKHPGHVILVDSDEHDEYGNIIEGAEVRTNMVDKRMKKMELLKTEVEEPISLGEPNPTTLLLAWGSTYGPLKEAVEALQTEGHAIGALVFGDIWPLPVKKLKAMAQQAKKIVNIEQNATGQLASLIREVALIPCSHRILKYDGRPFSGQEIYNRINQEVL